MAGHAFYSFVNTLGICGGGVIHVTFFFCFCFVDLSLGLSGLG